MYKLLETEFQMELYLTCVKHPQIMWFLSKFRTNWHMLRIKTVHKPKFEALQRTGLFCNSDLTNYI